ncbi:hypothetical protein [Deinococcus sp.]|uniref:hypothetical protein n=1 Tax=Deinococcus sp. TaxID=47478 RepID=UPI0025D4CCC9|nr:hypothetical protein [Deinococcus sp.]
MKKVLFMFLPVLLLSSSVLAQDTAEVPGTLLIRCAILNSLGSKPICPPDTYPRPIPPRPGLIVPKPTPSPHPCLPFMRCIPFPIFN